MMHDKTIRTFRTVTLGASRAVTLSLLSGLVSVACAGGDTPVRDRNLEASIREAYVGGGPVAPSGAGGSGPANPPSGAGGAAPAPTGAGGSEPAPPAGAGGGAPVAAGGSGGGDPPGCDGFAILESSCGQSSCHGAGSGQSGFAESEDVARTFVGQSGSTDACATEGPLFDPANPTDSVVIQKLTDDPPCGSKMPFGPALSEEDVSCLEEWIGALE
jgi:hypothetical protein